MMDARLLAGALAGLLAASPALADASLARSRNCVACHHAERRMIGPPYAAIAERYANDADAATRLAAKIRAGGAGVWGQTPMPPQPTVTETEAETLARWILTVQRTLN